MPGQPTFPVVSSTLLMVVSPLTVEGIFPLSFFASAVFIIPIGVLTAVTGYQTDLEILFNIVSLPVSIPFH